MVVISEIQPVDPILEILQVPACYGIPLPCPAGFKNSGKNVGSNGLPGTDQLVADVFQCQHLKRIDLIGQTIPLQADDPDLLSEVFQLGGELGVAEPVFYLLFCPLEMDAQSIELFE